MNQTCKTKGRPRRAVDTAELMRLRESGATWDEIASKLRVGRGTAVRAHADFPKLAIASQNSNGGILEKTLEQEKDRGAGLEAVAEAERAEAAVPLPVQSHVYEVWYDAGGRIVFAIDEEFGRDETPGMELAARVEIPARYRSAATLEALGLLVKYVGVSIERGVAAG